MARILVVDDDQNIVRAVQLALQTKGHEVVTAGSKEEGEAAAIANKPDLMVVDVMMPEGTEGFHLVWKMRQMEDEALKNVPIIMATGIHETTEMRFYPDQTDGTYEPGEFLPVQDWIDKPIKVEELLEKVGRLLTE
ncbi:MAG: response regulator [Armatimonadota bacterium]|nr:MAG: response regulator [Armatimonadota bacterium]